MGDRQSYTGFHHVQRSLFERVLQLSIRVFERDAELPVGSEVFDLDERTAAKG